MHTPPERPQRVPFWQLVLFGAMSLFRGAVHPLETAGPSPSGAGTMLVMRRKSVS